MPEADSENDSGSDNIKNHASATQPPLNTYVACEVEEARVFLSTAMQLHNIPNQPYPDLKICTGPGSVPPDTHWKLQLGTQELEEPLGKRAGRTLKLVLPAPRLDQSHGHRPSGPTLRPGEVPPRAGEPRVGNIPPQEWEHANGGGKLGQRIFFSSVFREPPTPRSALTSVCHPRVAENADSTQKKDLQQNARQMLIGI